MRRLHAEKALLFLAIPVLELVFLRFYLHSVLRLSIGFVGVTDFDFMIPGPIAFSILVFGLESAAPAKIALQRRTLLWNALSFFSFLLVNHLHVFLDPFPVLNGVLWHSLLGTVVVSGFCIWVSPRYYLFNPNRKLFVPTLLIAFLFPVYMNGFSNLWKVLLPFVHRDLSFLLPYFFGNGVETSVSPAGTLILTHPELKLRVGQGCLGLDGLLLFTFAILFLLLLDKLKLSKTQWLGVYVTGLAGIYFVNLFRILLLLAVGVLLKSNLGEATGLYLFSHLAHAHAGWILYLTFLVVYVLGVQLIFGRERSVFSYQG